MQTPDDCTNKGEARDGIVGRSFASAGDHHRDRLRIGRDAGSAGRVRQGAGPADADPSASREISRGGSFARGIAFVLAPEWGGVYRNALRRIRDDIRAALDAEKVRFEHLRISGGAVRLRVSEASAIERAKAGMARAARSWNLTPAASMPGLVVHAQPDGEVSLQLTAFGLAALHDGFIAASTKEIARRLKGNGFEDYLLTDDGERIRLEIPPMAAPAHAGRQC